MQTVMTPVESIVYHDQRGQMVPKRIKYVDSSATEEVTINIDRAVLTGKLGSRNDLRLVYRCRSIVNDVIRNYELLYDVTNTRWFLYRI